MATNEEHIAELLTAIVTQLMPVQNKDMEAPVKGVVGSDTNTMTYKGKVYSFLRDPKLRLQKGDVGIFVPIGNATFYCVGKI